jgi:cupin superfamily acireductone dioxygenase involved in methionine salvage
MTMYKQNQQLIHHNVPTPLSTIAYHHDVACIERFFSNTFPMHLAIHKVTDAADVATYTDPHWHDVPEINIIISDEAGDLVYEVLLGDETFQVVSNATIWIPAGMTHATNVRAGSGYYIAIRLNGYGVAQLEQRFPELVTAG